MARPLKLNIETKLLLGYLPLVLVMILIAFHALNSLKSTQTIGKYFVENDMVVVETASTMMDILISQELYGRRYVILQSPEMLDLFWQRSRQFDHQINLLRKLPGRKHIPVKLIAILHSEFNSFYLEWLEYSEAVSMERARALDLRIQGKLDELMTLIQTMVLDVKRDQHRQLLKVGEIGLKAFRTMSLLASLGIIVGIAAASLITRNISRSIQQLKLSTQEISEGRFDNVPMIKARDELGELAIAFGQMARRLAQLEEMYLDANPLTRLPGSVAIDNVLKKRLEGSLPLAFCVIDLDHFKAYNDRYGYAKGNKVIKLTADIIDAAVMAHGSGNDCVGHVGGDDFVVITTPDKYAKICQTITENFDQSIGSLYDEYDRQQGFIVGKTRQGQPLQYPMMTISIAVVTSDHEKECNPLQLSEIAAELKSHAKNIPHSVYVVNRRDNSGPSSDGSVSNNR